MNYRTRKSAAGSSGWGERIEYRVVVLLAFTLCLVAVAGKRLFGQGTTQNGSLFEEAYSVAMAAVGYAYTA